MSSALELLLPLTHTLTPSLTPSQDPRCKYRKDCGKTPELRTSTHLYLCLDKLQPEIEAYFKEAVATGKWSSNAQDITQSWFDRGLEPRAITRDLKWGTPVPLEGFTDKVWPKYCVSV